ncbi:DUF4198 domain-containing protein [Ammonifex thiophilus]|uniref:DUF4198 domain-containing protein n=1 Tax=Ammonifex thiophilus TaxID=444093 RepID=A0A3D8P116_9THEO|nr:DUF4198 domain-containing protein [Ammonifex thiophilus]RDV80960.1 DUF4198 domain-containing protein [Ammonifex thiophilus]
MLRVVQGHEIWVIPEASHFHMGTETRCRVFYGHAGRPDGLADLNRLSAWVLKPEGKRLNLAVTAGDNTFHLVKFVPDEDGFWAVTVENDVGAIALKGGLFRQGTRRDFPDAKEVSYYHQYAKTFVQVGHLHEEETAVIPASPVRLGHELELVAVPGPYRLGSELVLEVYYRGQPLPGAEVKANWSLREGKDWAWTRRADSAGKLKITLDQPGHWLFYVRHTDDTLGKEGEYDKVICTATLSFYGVR